MRRIVLVCFLLGISAVIIAVVTLVGQPRNGAGVGPTFCVIDPSTRALLLNTSDLYPTIRFGSMYHYAKQNMTPEYSGTGMTGYWLLFGVSKGPVLGLEIFSFPDVTEAGEFLYRIMGGLGATPDQCYLRMGDECLSLSSTELGASFVALRKGSLVTRVMVQGKDGSLMSQKEVEQLASEVASALQPYLVAWQASSGRRAMYTGWPDLVSHDGIRPAGDRRLIPGCRCRSAVGIGQA